MSEETQPTVAAPAEEAVANPFGAVELVSDVKDYYDDPKFDAIVAELRRPFPTAFVEWKPQTNPESGKTSCLVVCYVDPRRYEERLDQVAPGWTRSYEPLGAQSCTCTVSIRGVSRSAIGEFASSDKNPATTMEAQAFKRACEAFGLGRDFYNLPPYFAEYKDKHLVVSSLPELPKWYKANAYQAINIWSTMTPTTPAPESTKAVTVPAELPKNVVKFEAPKLTCGVCGKEIKDAINSSGKVVKADFIAKKGKENYMQAMCWEDYQIARTNFVELDATKMTEDEVWRLMRLFVGEMWTPAMVAKAMLDGTLLAKAQAYNDKPKT